MYYSVTFTQNILIVVQFIYLISYANGYVGAQNNE